MLDCPCKYVTNVGLFELATFFSVVFSITRTPWRDVGMFGTRTKHLHGLLLFVVVLLL